MFHFSLKNKLLALFLILSGIIPAVLALSQEEVPAGEAAATTRIEHTIEEQVRSQAKKEKTGKAHRDAHAKAHGCVTAHFDIQSDIPEGLRAGVFKTARRFQAWIRYSNGSGQSQNDSEGDGRGMAVKLMGVGESPSTTQDFIMINHPVFFVRNADDYVELTDAIAKSGSPKKFFFPGLNPFHFRWHEFGIARDIREKKLANPLEARYWSMTPYQLGENETKFSARPHPCIPTPSRKHHWKKKSPNYLRENMQNFLNQEDACFDFQVQLRTEPSEMPIEDPTIEWSETLSPFITVAQITIPKQSFTSPSDLNFCENLSYTPWHNVPEQRPLGGINRVRKVVYETISRVRHELNNAFRAEPHPSVK